MEFLVVVVYFGLIATKKELTSTTVNGQIICT